jgi:hypothetical protein
MIHAVAEAFSTHQQSLPLEPDEDTHHAQQAGLHSLLHVRYSPKSDRLRGVELCSFARSNKMRGGQQNHVI